MRYRAIVCAYALLVALPACQAAVCTATAGALAFGIYDTVLATDNDTTGTVQVTCTPGVAQPLTTGYTITIAGTGTGGDSVRSVAAGAYRLYYQLYKDAARTTVWGNGA
jgi:spore coat protein U-like protein